MSEEPAGIKKFSKGILLQDAIDRHEESRTENASINLQELNVGDSLKIEFYPDENTAFNYTPLYLTISEQSKPNYFVSAVCSGGQADWNNQQILVDGSVLSPHVPATKPDVVEPGLFLGYRIFKPDLIPQQEKNEVPILTAWGNMPANEYADALRKMPDRFPTEDDVQKAVKGRMGWVKDFTPKVADFKLDKIGH